MIRDRAAVVVLVVTMTCSTFQLFAVAVVAKQIIDDLGIDRTEFGVIGAVNTIVGAMLAPRLGRIVDRIGSRRAIVIVLATSALGLALTAAPSYPMLLVASFISGIPQGAGNPATNRYIAAHVAEGSRGVITGIKQSGVQVGVFLTGAITPSMADLVGWRTAVGLLALVPAVLILPAWWLFPDDLTADDEGAGAAGAERGDAGTRSSRALRAERATRAGDAKFDADPTPEAGPAPLDQFVYRVAAYGFLLGLVGGGVSRFLPLFAQERLDMSSTSAGFVAGSVGLIAIGARIAWGRLAESRIHPRRALLVMAVISVGATGLLVVAEAIGAWVLWLVALLLAVGSVSWNAVGMLAVITGVPQAQSGRASGVVLLGFLGGLSVASLAVGASVDRFDSYSPAWATLTLAGALAAALMSSNLPGARGSWSSAGSGSSSGSRESSR